MLSRRKLLVSAAGGLSSTTAGCTLFEPNSENVCDAGSLAHGDIDLKGVDGAWRQYQFDAANTGASPDGRGVPEQAGIAWRYATCVSMGESGPAVSDGTVYVASSQRPGVYAFDAITGAAQWSVEESGGDTVPAVGNGTVYVAGDELVAVDAGDGTERWRAGTPEQFSMNASPTAAGGVVYVAGGYAFLNAFDASTGDRLWKALVDRNITSSTPAVAAGTVFIVNEAGTMFAFDAVTGEEQWTVGGARREASPVATNGRVYLTMPDGLMAVNPGGEIQWTAAMTDWLPNPPAVTSERAFVTEQANLYALDLGDGSIEWDREFDHSLGIPVAADGTVYVGQHGYSTGEGPEGAIIAVDAATGETRWRLTTRGMPGAEGGLYAGTRGSLAVLHGALYACTGAGDIVAIGPA